MRPEEAKKIAQDLHAVMNKFSAEHGIKVKVGSLAYDATGFRVSITGSIVEGGVDVRARDEFRTYASSFGLSPDDFGRQFISTLGSMKVVGIKPRSSRFPILCESVGGKLYKFSAPRVVAALAKGEL